MFHVSVTNLLGFFITPKVVAAFRQTHSTLESAGDHLRAVFLILLAAEAEENAGSISVQAGNLLPEAGQVADMSNAVEFRLKRLGAFTFDSSCIHATRVKV